ncbi:uncharacterized protein [Macrobrachium rosenbergii]|uniref:uncharacterized protein isoform X1 n=1 Tax=Macrobrachium rosenbergii TaxID=79674 RepID=UPI0034D783EE
MTIQETASSPLPKSIPSLNSSGETRLKCRDYEKERVPWLSFNSLLSVSGQRSNLVNICQLSENHRCVALSPSCVMIWRQPNSRNDCSGEIENGVMGLKENDALVKNGVCHPLECTRGSMNGLYLCECNTTAGETDMKNQTEMCNIVREIKSLVVKETAVPVVEILDEHWNKNMDRVYFKTISINSLRNQCISLSKPSGFGCINELFHEQNFPVHIIVICSSSSYQIAIERCILNVIAYHCSSSILSQEIIRENIVPLCRSSYCEFFYRSCTVVSRHCLGGLREDLENTYDVEDKRENVFIDSLRHIVPRVSCRTLVENRPSAIPTVTSCRRISWDALLSWASSFICSPMPTHSTSTTCLRDAAALNSTRTKSSHRSSSPLNLRPRRSSTCLWVVFLLILSGLHGRVTVRASEFPDRECCDSAPPPPPHYHTTTSTTPVPEPKPSSTSTIIPTLHSLLPTSSVPPTGDGAVGVRNCLLARQQCADDPSCRSVLEIIPRVCGPEDVACSTVTVDKCLAALRFLGGFPYFRPTCLCRERHLDKDCNLFREFIFDHPCMFVENKDKSPYQVHALPLCEYALNACEQLPGCINLYEKFRESCRVRDDQCRMDDTNECLSSWNKLKQSPMFGCICPVDHQKRKCQRIFRIVHNNPCVDTFPASSSSSSSPSSYIPSPYSSSYGKSRASVWEFILPPPTTQRPRFPPLPPYIHPHRQRPRPHVPWVSRPLDPLPLPPHVPYITAEPLPAFSAQTHNVLTVDQDHTFTTTTAITSRMSSVGNSPGSFPVNIIPRDNSSLHAAVDTQIQNPLVVVDDPKGGGRRQNASRAADVLGQRFPTDPQASETSSSGPVPMLHSTCQTALVGCNGDDSCRRLLDPVLAVCDNQCNREACMGNLQTFYRNVDFKWAIEVAFCLCKKSSQTADECLSAQEKLHPSCARKPAGKVPMLCNRLAAACKEDPGCRHRLEFYEQACAVDSDTRRCAGSTAECRRALLGILGTQLRNLCTCSAPDPMETYTCLDWQRILWFNPCVVEAQTDYHREMLAGTKEEITTTPSIVITPSIITGVISEPVQQNGGDHSVQNKGSVVIHPKVNTTIFYAPTRWEPQPLPPTQPVVPSTTTTTTPAPTTLPPKYCEKRHASGDTIDYIEEGWGKRFYKDEECSELCLCHAEEKLACSVLECVEARACETDFAVFNHYAPAYQADRGECFCYSGSFICVRPPIDEYEVKDGVFLFLGYSKAEENLLRPYTKISLVDAALSKLSDLVRESALIMNGRDRRVSSQDTRHIKTECHLELVTKIGENIILQAKLEEFEYLRDNMTAEMLHKEKEECEDSVAEVSKMINTHEKEVREDMALSVLILAEMQVHMPPLTAGAGIAHCPPLILVIVLALVALISTQHSLLAS